MSRPITEEPPSFSERRPKTSAVLKSTAKTAGEWLVKAGVIASILTALDRYGVRPVLNGSQDQVDGGQNERIVRLEDAMTTLTATVNAYIESQPEVPKKRGRR